MASLHPSHTEPSGQALARRLMRGRTTSRAPGDEFGMGGWHHTSNTIAPPDPPNVLLVLLPFIVLLIVGITITLTALYLDGKL